MQRFEYTAIDQAGRTRSGALIGEDTAAARRQIERRGLVVTSLKSGGAAVRARTPAGADGGRLNPRALALMTRQLSTLLAVAPVEEALRTLREQTDHAPTQRALVRLHEGVLEGKRLSDSMAAAGGRFPVAYRAMVSAGEASGALPAILERLADLLEKQQDVRGKLASALIYPAVLAIVAVVVVAALMTFVVPQVVDQFNTSGQALPALTRAIIAISGFLVNWGWLVLAAVAAGLALFALALRAPATRLAFDRAMFGLPVIGRLLRDVEAAGFARTLSTMIASGVPALEALQLAARTSANSVMRAAATDMATSVREGSGLATAMRRTKAFPPLLVYLTSSGESSGKLEVMLDRAADYLEREFRTATSVALSLLEPAIIIVMGGVVCLVILSILLPILQINTLAAA